jgi:hypothetical protein
VPLCTLRVTPVPFQATIDDVERYLWRRIRRCTLAAMVVAIGVASCRAEDNNTAPAAIPSATSTGLSLVPGQQDPLHRPAQSNLELELIADRTSYRHGDLVHFVGRLTNLGPHIVQLEFHRGQRFDIEVIGDRGLVWRWSDGRVFTQAAEDLALEPGEDVVFEAVWDMRTRDGRLALSGYYRALLTFAAHGFDRSAAADFDLD